MQNGKADLIARQRKAAVWLLARGILTQSEVASLAKTSRQRVAYWASVEGLDCIEARKRMLAKAWRDSMAK